MMISRLQAVNHTIKESTHSVLQCLRSFLPAYIQIELDNTSFPPGGMLTGKVILIVNSSELYVDKLTMRMTGFEYAYISKTPGEAGRPHTWASTTDPLLDFSCPLRHYRDGSIERGHYEIPLELELPGNIPNSLVIVKGIHFCRILYFLEIRLIRTGFLSLDVVKKIPIVIKGYKDSDIEPNTLQQEVVPVPYYSTLHRYTCGMFGEGLQGFLYLGLYLEDANVIAGNDLTISFMVQNNTTEKIHQIGLYLEENLYFTAEEKHKEFTKGFSSLIFTPNPKTKSNIPSLSSLPFDLTPIDQADIFQHKKVLPGKLSVEDLNDRLRDNYCTVKLRVRKNTKPSKEGGLIRIRHFVVLRVNSVETYVTFTVLNPVSEEDIIETSDQNLEVEDKPSEEERVEESEEKIPNDEREFA